MIVNTCGTPVQVPFGVTVIVAVATVFPAFTVVKLLISPELLPASPIEGVLFVQLYVVLLTAPLKFTVVVEAPAHTDWLETALTVGAGFTVISKALAVPGQPAAVGVTVTVAVTGVAPAFTVAKLLMSPELLPLSPMDGVLLVQLYVVLPILPPKVTAVVDAPAQSVWLETVFTVGIGFTVISNVFALPGQPAAIGVTVMVAVTGVIPAFTVAKLLISVFPLPVSPIDGVLFVQL